MDLISRRAVIDILATMQGLCTSKAALTQNSKIWQQIKDLPSAERTVAHIQDFIDYQTDWLTEHNDLELEPELEDWVIRFLQDTASCYQKEYLTAERKGDE